MDEPAAKVVQSIYEKVLDGLPLREISMKLQEQELSIPGQYLRTGHLYREREDEVKLWRVGTISNILHNQLYIGNMVQGKRKVRHYKGEGRHVTDKDEWIILESTHEPIVSKEMFEEVQMILSEKVEASSFSSERTRSIPVKENRFKGILYCSICGERLRYASTVPSRVDAERKYYFACEGNYNLQVATHKGIRITEETLEDILKELIGELFRQFQQSDHSLARIVKAEWKSGNARWMKEIRKVGRKLKNLDAGASARYEDYVLGEISREAFLNGKGVEEEKREALDHALQQLREKQMAYEAGIREKMQWLLELERASEGELDGELIHLLIVRIELYPRHEFSGLF